ncbi:MAG: hypothetical protein JNJ56_12855 [Ignavibacteria bacterium]|nr:hypothetical protein [Ignavibacteria bacterium]
MKKIHFFSLLITFLLSPFVSVFSHINSVELRTGGGVFISSHNSINDAYNAIPLTITQPYLIEILPSYDGSLEIFPVNFSSRTGSSSINTITVRPQAGNSGEIIVTSITSNPVIKFNDADYVILDGRPGGTGTLADLTIQNTSTSNAQANTIQLINGATHNEIKFCRTVNATMAVSGPANIFIDFSNSNPSGNSDNIISDCDIIGGRTGVRSSGTPANKNNNNLVTRCSIYDFGFAAVWHESGTNNMTVEKCNIFMSTGYNITNPSAINIQSTETFNFTIRKNKLSGIKSSSVSSSLNIRGIFTQQRPGSGSVINVENNFIALNDNNNNVATTYGIATGAEVSGTSNPYTINIFYNTIKIGGVQTTDITGLSSAGILKASSNSGIKYNQKNNICINSRTGGSAGIIHTGSAINNTAGTLAIDYNCYYSSYGSAYCAVWNSTGYSNLANYKYASNPNEQNSRFKDVNFVSTNDLHLFGSSIGDGDLSARPVQGITTDIDDVTRSSSFPYKGADESTAFILLNLNLKVSLEACSPVQDTVTVLIRNTVTPYEIVETSSGYLDGSGNVLLSFAKPLNSVSYYLTVRHRNSIETWSKSGGEIFTGNSLNFDFTASSSQAYGNNMVYYNNLYSFFTGDVNQDEIVDAADLSYVENDALYGLSGYYNTDLNCDDFVDASDLSFCENNAGVGVYSVHP